jgi:hypothetical protein
VHESIQVTAEISEGLIGIERPESSGSTWLARLIDKAPSAAKSIASSYSVRSEPSG